MTRQHPATSSAAILLLVACLTSCATMPDIGRPIDRADPDCGYCSVTPVVAERQKTLAFEDEVYQSNQIEYLHLADGALSDNLGVPTVVDTITSMGTAERGAASLGMALPKKIVFVLVNAANQPGRALARQARAPDELQTARLAA